MTFDALAKDFITDYRINNRDTLAKAERSVKYLKESFEGMRATDITTDKVKAYIEKRMEQGLSNASINRELAALKRMFHLAAKCTPPRVSMIPYIPMMKESNVRKGFFERHEFVALRNALFDYVRPIVTVAYHTGWRKEEILPLTWDKVDLQEDIIRLDPGDTKNEEARTYYMNNEVREEIQKAHSNRQLGCPYVFHRNGQQIRDFREAWKVACKKAGLKGRLFHDFRRTAIRDMIRSGTPERVAMNISGHKTRSVFERYNIVSDKDLREASRKKEAYYEAQDKNLDHAEMKRGEVIPIRQAQHE